MKLMDYIKDNITFFDGGLGSQLQERGLKPGELPEIWNITHPDVVTAIHKDYFAAGSNIVCANSFGANSFKYNDNSEYTLEQILSAAIQNVANARDLTKPQYIALDIGPLGKLLEPFGELSFDEAYEHFAEIVKLGADGADLIIIETMNDIYELKAAVLAAKENSDLPVFASVTFDSNGKLLTGADALTVVSVLEGLNVDALGINCSLGPVQMKDIIDDILRLSSIPVIINPNAGLPQMINGTTVYDISPDEFAAGMREFALKGARLLGGCCGTTPLHIKKLVEACSDVEIKPITDKGYTAISSYSQTVIVNDAPVLIGERINPTGKPLLKQALRDNNLQYILDIALEQVDLGVHILDVNTGLPGIDETAMLTQTVKSIQEVTNIPLQLDTADIKALDSALRIYNGKALINSVNGKSSSMDAVFPLVKKYGGVVVALLLDETGIPETAEGRYKIAEKIYSKALEYGLTMKNLIFDALSMTISTNSENARITLDTLRLIHDRLGGHTILGVSNISFGLPRRELINASFLTMALQNHLSAAIINPKSADMMQAYDCFLALSSYDKNCEEYIEKYANTVKQEVAASINNSYKPTSATANIDNTNNEQNLSYFVKRGLKEKCEAATTELLETTEPLVIINKQLIPALDAIGEDFEKGKLFLPQLLTGAETAKAAFTVINKYIAEHTTAQVKKYKIVLATVKGDIHDIGKNIVKVLLENYGYDVIDLGKDVEPELVVKTAIEQKALLVGLSALMTTTVPAMADTIKMLREQAPDIKVIVGGAVLTEAYAYSIGADAYGKDAMATVRYAESL